MNAFAQLSTAAGTWRGTNTLQDPNAGTPADSASDATITSVLGGRFLRVDYTWSYNGEPQEGSILFGFQPKEGTCTAYWIDTFHNGRKGMLCTGTMEKDGSLTVHGSYPAPPGPDWGWRMTVTPPSEAQPELRVDMFNIWPESQGGQEERAVEAHYTRA